PVQNISNSMPPHRPTGDSPSPHHLPHFLHTPISYQQFPCESNTPAPPHLPPFPSSKHRPLLHLPRSPPLPAVAMDPHPTPF
uniref:Uncharacterized protein n=1 Tax=Aegilops tauschii subsp. strangulata TaxID=200361 RepID=A0A453IB57_AEGTS